MEKLFEIEAKSIEEKCKDCDYCEKWHCNSKVFFIAPQGEAIELITASLRLKRIIKLADHLNHQNENNQQILTLAIQHPSAQISEREAGAGV